MKMLKRGLVTAAIVGSLVGGVAAMPGGVAAKAEPNQNGANCHGVSISRDTWLQGTGIGNIARDNEISVKEAQQKTRDTCAKIYG